MKKFIKITESQYDDLMSVSICEDKGDGRYRELEQPRVFACGSRLLSYLMHILQEFQSDENTMR